MEQKSSIARIHDMMLDHYKHRIEALVDDELSPQSRKKTLELIRHVPELQAYYATLLKQKYSLQKWWHKEKEKVH